MKQFFLFYFLLLFLVGCTQVGKDCSLSGPVCALVEIQCITTPCNPIQQTFDNECEALKVNTKSVTKGPCEVISNFTECINAGNPAMESYPRQCKDTIANRTFTEII